MRKSISLGLFWQAQPEEEDHGLCDMDLNKFLAALKTTGCCRSCDEQIASWDFLEHFCQDWSMLIEVDKCVQVF